jgi:hopene-associated glycosyltransferase HpnB
VTVLSAPPLPGGWTGKLWAQHHGVKHAQTLPEPPDYLLLTDADIRHATDTLTALVLRAVHDRTVLTSLMASLHCENRAERAMIPAFIFFFQMLYPFAWVNRANRATAAAAGGCMLVRRQSLQAAGGVAAIRGELIDDCALARLLKSHGPIWLGLTRRVHSVRACATIGEIRGMIVRSAYAQLCFSPWWLAFAGGDARRLRRAPPIGLVRQRHPTIARSVRLGADDVGISTDTAFLSRLAVVGRRIAGDRRFVPLIYPRIGLSVHTWQRRGMERTCTLSRTLTMPPATFRRSEHS